MIETKKETAGHPRKDAPRIAMLDRPRLMAPLDLLRSGSLPLAVWATAGSGKTTLLSAWRDRLEASGLPVVWADLSLLAERSLAETVDDALGAYGSRGACVILDDVHVFHDRADQEWIANFRTEHDESTRLIVGGRYRPPALTAFAATGPPVELRSRDIAFTHDEAAELFRSREVELTEAQLLSVLQKTEGWAVALSLLADRLVGTQDVAAVIDAFGSDRHGVADYLVSEVLSTQHAQLERFLLQTCVVDDITVPLASALSGRDDAGEFLEQLEDSNTLVRSAGSAEKVYRYHAMLTSYLRAQLRRRNLPASINLHHTAARWYDKHGRHDQALEHLLQGEDPAALADGLDRHGLRLVFSGDAYRVQRALDAMDEFGVATPGTHVLAALLTAPYFRDDLCAEHNLRLARKEVERMSAHNRLAFHSLVVMRVAGRSPGDRELVERALGELHESLRRGPADDGEDSSWLDARLFAEVARGWAFLHLGQSGEALPLLLDAAEAARQSGRQWLYLLMLDLGATAAGERGMWAHVVSLQERMADAIKQGGRPTDLVAARSQFAVAADAYQRGEPFSAARIQDIMAADRHHLDAGLSVPASVLGILFRLDGEPNPRRLYDDLDRILQAQGHFGKRTLASAAYRYVDLSLRFRGRGGAREVVSFIADQLGRNSLEARLAELQLHVGTASQSTEERLLEEELGSEFQAWNPASIVLGWMTLARVAEAGGRDAIADLRLVKALGIAQQMRIRRPFLAARGMGVALVESRLGRLGADEEFAESIVRLYHDTMSPAPRHEVDEMVLTAKEHEVLRELPRHQSVGDIAHNQRLSPNTIKTHLRSIYQKLGVGGRAEAVDRAKAVGLL